ncbi:MAG: hypothetical protein ACOCVZ_09615, partial [Gemmatimonadota bacterium]
MRVLLALVLVSATAACALPPRDAWPATPGSRSSSQYGTGWIQGPLRATVWFDEYTGLASFDVSRPAHVAMFAVQPLGALELIYPRFGYGSGRAFRSGRHNVRTEFQPYRLASDRWSWGRGYDDYYGGRQPLYILLIAADRPLRLDHFHGLGRASWLGYPGATWNPFLVTESLAREVVPAYSSTDWTVAYHVVWPAADFRRDDGRVPYTRVVCPGNRVFNVPTEALRGGWFTCPDPDVRDRDGRVAIPRKTGRGITETVPKRPRPGGWAGATPTTPERGGTRDALGPKRAGDRDGDRARSGTRPQVPVRPGT